jgi:hypothetical protein
MSPRWLVLVLAVGLAQYTCAVQPCRAQVPYQQAYQLQRWYYYPYYYFPHNYWPATGPRWPEKPNQPYMPPPAYQAYPPFLEPNWRYDLWQPMRFYRGNHFWLDAW